MKKPLYTNLVGLSDKWKTLTIGKERIKMKYL